MTGHRLRVPLLAAALSLAFGMARPARSQSAPPATSPNYALVTTAAKRVRGELTTTYRAPKLEADEWAVYAARLPELPGQVGARSAMTPTGVALRELSDEARPLIGTRVVVAAPGQRTEMVVRVTYDATLLARKLAPLGPGEAAPKVAPLDPKERRLALAPTRQFDFKSPAVRAWLDARKLGRVPGEGDVDLARRIFLEVKKGISLGADGAEHLASRAFESGKTDGAGLVIAFVSALRGEGLPARLLAGRRAESSGVEPLSKRPYDPLHLRAEFFAQGVGWVPADILPAVARDDSPEGLRYFGTDEGDFVTFHAGTDLILETFFGPKTVEWLQDPSFWVLGGGSFDGVSARAEWKVKAEPVDPAEAVARKAATKAPTRKSRGAPAARPGP